MNATLISLAVFALLLVGFALWALHRSRRWVDHDRERHPQHYKDLPP